MPTPQTTQNFKLCCQNIDQITAKSILHPQWKSQINGNYVATLCSNLAGMIENKEMFTRTKIGF